MNIFNQIKAGAKIAPAFVIPTYYFLVFLDIYSTFLVTPDLKFEANWIIRLFNLNWAQIVLFASIGCIALSMWFLYSMHCIYSLFKDRVNLIRNYSFFNDFI